MMRSTPSTLRLLAGGVLLLLLTACGGGDGNAGGSAGGSVTSPSAAVDNYAGTWVECVAGGTGGSEKNSMTFTKTGDTTMSLAISSRSFGTANCTGAEGPTLTDSGSVTFNGTKVIGSETVDRIDVVQSTGSFKQVLVIRADGRLYSGNLSAGTDGQGYPNALDPGGLTRQ
jgi:hypothetical protein